jgi:orotidine-5'-phosphate decarboxylase
MITDRMTTPAGAAVSDGPLPTFARRWSDRVAERSPLCLGVAPSRAWLARWNLPDDVRGAASYCANVLAVAGELAGVKIQTPFFARFGEAGLDLLRRFIDGCHGRGTLVLLDAKIGDADDTMEAYLDLYLGPGSRLGGDALTANAFMGFGSLQPLFARAAAVGAAVFLMVRTSNHAAGEYQRATGPDGRTVAQILADAVTGWNQAQAPGDPVGPLGAVVGARLPESADLVGRLERSVLEIPGLGRSDRDPDEVLAPVRDRYPRTLVTVTTGVLRHGPDVCGLSEAIAGWRSVLGSA